MLDITKLNLNSLSKDEILAITKQELEEYKTARQYNNVSSNITRIKALDKLNKRLSYFAMYDSNIQSVRSEINTLLNEDVYKQDTKDYSLKPFSSREEFIKAHLRSK